MKLLVSNVSWSLRLPLIVLRATGFWRPRTLTTTGRIIWGAFTVLSCFFLAGINIITQAAELVFVLGDVSQMTRIMLLLITNMTMFFKMVNIVWRVDKIREIVDDMDMKLRIVEGDDEKSIVSRSDKFPTWYLYVYTFLSLNTVYGLAFTARKPEFPLPARYPYDTTKSPAFELSCSVQIIALNIAALANIALDSLVSSLIFQCCCRFKLLALALTKICHDLDTTGNKMISEKDEKIVFIRLRRCIDEHQDILIKAKEIEDNFSMPVFGQLTISSLIICVTAYQLAFEEKTVMLLWSLLTYITVMMMQVFMYCYHGNELSILSTEISGAAYHCLWYKCSTKIRRALLILMIRSGKEVRIKVGGITVLSLGTFMKVIKASYTFFTVLQSVQE